MFRRLCTANPGREAHGDPMRIRNDARRRRIRLLGAQRFVTGAGPKHLTGPPGAVSAGTPILSNDSPLLIYGIYQFAVVDLEMAMSHEWENAGNSGIADRLRQLESEFVKPYDIMVGRLQVTFGLSMNLSVRCFKKKKKINRLHVFKIIKPPGVPVNFGS